MGKQLRSRQQPPPLYSLHPVHGTRHPHILQLSPSLFVPSVCTDIIAPTNITTTDLTNVPDPTTPPKCAVIAPELCTTLNKDPFTIVLTVWIGLQLIWVTMLIIVQLLQVARGLTTYEAMRGYSHPRPTAADAVTSFIATGTTSPDAGSLTAAGAGPTAIQPGPNDQQGSGSGSQQNGSGGAGGHGHKHPGCWDTWKRLLGLDTFLATALWGSRTAASASGGSRPRADEGNPFSRGLLRNCQDFWCDPGPLLFRSRENGVATFGGERVDYTRLYDVPPRMRMRRAAGGEEYREVGTEEV
jgi:palmitoyltransferase ZDHHC13/17